MLQLPLLFVLLHCRHAFPAWVQTSSLATDVTVSLEARFGVAFSLHTACCDA